VMPDACIDVGLFEKTGGQKLPKSGENSSCGAFRYLLSPDISLPYWG
jgi:hypothetical protein